MMMMMMMITMIVMMLEAWRCVDPETSAVEWDSINIFPFTL
jgi:hypothetical protein